MLRTTTILLAALTLAACTEEGDTYIVVVQDASDTDEEVSVTPDAVDVADVEDVAELPEATPDAVEVQDVGEDVGPTDEELEEQAREICANNDTFHRTQCSNDGRMRVQCNGDDRRSLLDWGICEGMCARSYEVGEGGCMPIPVIDCEEQDYSEGAVKFCFVASGNDWVGDCDNDRWFGGGRCPDDEPHCWPTRGTCEHRPPDPGEE